MSTAPEIKIAQQLSCSALSFLAGQSINRASHQEVFHDGQRIEERQIFRQYSDLPLNFERRTTDGLPANQDFAAGWLKDAGEHLYGGGFPRAVWSKKTK